MEKKGHDAKVERAISAEMQPQDLKVVGAINVGTHKDLKVAEVVTNVEKLQDLRLMAINAENRKDLKVAEAVTNAEKAQETKVVKANNAGTRKDLKGAVEVTNAEKAQDLQVVQAANVVITTDPVDLAEAISLHNFFTTACASIRLFNVKAQRSQRSKENLSDKMKLMMSFDNE